MPCYIAAFHQADLPRIAAVETSPPKQATPGR
jgi:hypothetical protein